MTTLTVVLLLVALVVWLVAPGVIRRREQDEVEPVDAEELLAAEHEVRDLDLRQDPDQGWPGDDWGPGAGGGTDR